MKRRLSFCHKMYLHGKGEEELVSQRIVQEQYMPESLPALKTTQNVRKSQHLASECVFTHLTKYFLLSSKVQDLFIIKKKNPEYAAVKGIRMISAW